MTIDSAFAATVNQLGSSVMHLLASSLGAGVLLFTYKCALRFLDKLRVTTLLVIILAFIVFFSFLIILIK